jgi:hypothetical protein
MKKIITSLLVACIFCVPSQAAIVTPTFTPLDYSSLVSIGLFRGSAVFADINKDGYLDLLVKGRDLQNSWATTMKALINGGNGEGLTSSVNLTDGDGCSWERTLIPIDYDNDGYVDYILGNSWGYAQLHHNNGDLTFTLVDAFKDSNVEMLNIDDSNSNTEQFRQGITLVADFNMDGYPDIVTLENSTGGNPMLYVNEDGTGTFTRKADCGLFAQRGGSMCVGDYNQDGYPDILVAGWNDGVGGDCVRINQNNGDGTFTTVDPGIPGTEHGGVAFVDLDSDGLLDIVVTGVSSTNSWARTAAVYHNEGDGTFKDAGAALTGVDCSAIDWCDLNGDGLADLAYAGSIDSDPWGLTNVVINKGNMTFESHADLVSGHRGGTYIQLVDFNQNLIPDMAVMGYANDGTTHFQVLNGVVSNRYVNTLPTAPTNLKMTSQDGKVTFSWDAGTDKTTAQKALRYNVYVKTTDGKVLYNIPADVETGALRMGEVNSASTSCSYTMNIKEATVASWGVQSIDMAKGASPFAQGTATAIERIHNDQATASEVFDLNGRKVGNDVKGLGNGVFIVRQGGSAHKVVVR